MSAESAGSESEHADVAKDILSAPGAPPLAPSTTTDPLAQPLTPPPAASKTPATSRRSWRSTVPVVIACVALAAAMFFYREIRDRLKGSAAPAAASVPVVVLVDGSTDAVRVDEGSLDRLGIRTAKAKVAGAADALRLNGSLTIDPDRLEQVRSRFAGEVVEIAAGDQGREVRFGDRVRKGQLLAIVWSRELGEKKNELIDALSQLHVDAETLDHLESLRRDGSIPERQYREQLRVVQNDRITVSRILRTLQTWRVAPEEIAVVETEARRLIDARPMPMPTPAPGAAPAANDGRAPATPPAAAALGTAGLPDEQIDRWARVELRSALDGVVLERNISVGDIVSGTDDMFQVADLSRLRVMAYAYEEDLSRLDALPADRRRWTVRVPADPAGAAQSGSFDEIGDLIDPAQHTAFVMGWVDNAGGRLRAGQFVSAIVDLPAPEGLVVVPAAALVEKGAENILFVRAADGPVFTRKNVVVARQTAEEVSIVIDPRSSGRSGVAGIQPGEQVVVAGAVELEQALVDLKAARSATAKPPAR